MKINIKKVITKPQLFNLDSFTGKEKGKEKKKGRNEKGKYVKMQRPFQILERPIGNCCSITVSQIDYPTTP